MMHARSAFRFLMEAVARGEGMALVTITGVEGTSSRAPGAHMAVTESGTWLGSISGGCFEAVVVAEAQRIIASGRTELIRFGADSPYIDIQLPCGGGLDLLFLPNPASSALAIAYEQLCARVPVSLLLDKDGWMSATPSMPADRTSWIDDKFLVRHDPDLRLLIIGHGEETIALATLARAFGADVAVLTPDTRVAAEVTHLGLPAKRLDGPQRPPELVADLQTAVVLLFHDHDWEPELLTQALESEAFFIGAMGSRRTHAKRVEALLQRGVPARSIDRLVTPLGLIPSARDPDTLALSILSHVVELGRCTGMDR